MFNTSLKTLTAGAIVAACALALPAAAQETVLKYSSWFPESHSTNTVLKAWIAEVEEATDGRVTVEYLPKTVQGPREQFDVVVDGLADIVIVLPGYTPGRFPVLEIGELPLLVDTDEATLAPAFYTLYETEIAATEPFKGAKVLTTWASAPTHIATKPGPITSMEQMQGLKIRAPSATAGMVVGEMGAVTVQKPVTEIYELASSGIVDGTFFSYGPMISWKTKDIFQNVTLMPGGMGQSVIAVLMNQAKFDSLSEEDRTAIMEVSGEKLARAFGAAWQNDEDVAFADLGNLNVVEAPEEFFNAFSEAIAPVEAEWVEKAKAAGLEDPAATLENFRALLKAAQTN
ncbi:TRAP transporter substrate-binding protein [Sulfitobacter sp. HNIBRBA3233]|uniref:TRAP transporter substrate-binding protein n=1 Tax=Sulfitobacter marinivivus TaxID=3158558 RepID=UPI0032DE51E8